MILFIQRWWRRRQRQIDLEILWPECKRATPTLDHAKAAFAVHAFNDPAWTQEYGENLFNVIDNLE